MAANVPPALKAADVSRFVQRAAQVEKAKPVVAYWCRYWAVNQILSRGLHTTDNGCMTYTTTLMDKLEQSKAENAGNDAVTDDLAGQAYVEQFALETFSRADNAVRANKASRQTADTFQAAATFLDLSHIWGQPDPDIASKSKFAKYHALRIAKAIKAGEDPNLSNPAPEPSPQPVIATDDTHMINGPENADEPGTSDRQPYVEEVPDERSAIPTPHFPSPKLQLSSDHHEVPSPENRTEAVPYSAAPQEFYGVAPHENDISPLAPSPVDRTASVGGGYFPNVPDEMSSRNDLRPAQNQAEDLAPPSATDLPDLSAFQSSFSPPPPDAAPGQVSLSGPSNVSSPPSLTHHNVPIASRQTRSPHQPPTPENIHQPILSPTFNQASISTQQYAQHPRPQQPTSLPRSAPSGPSPQPTESSQAVYTADEAAMLEAQKHARWAISALNFEDVKTAVKELRGALQSLGAT